MCTRFEVVSARTIDGKDGYKRHVAYTILIRKEGADDDPVPVVIERRYTDFLELYKALGQDHPALTSHIYFPRKVILGNFTADLIKLRSHSFQNFLKVVAGNEKLRESPGLKLFLTGHEEKQARKWLEAKSYGQAKPILENIFRLLSKVHTDRHPSVMIALCRLTACCSADPSSLVDAEKYAELALRRFEGVSDIDLLCYYVPLLQLCINLWWVLGRDKEALESRLSTLKRHGHRVDGCTPLLESMLSVD
ncbi:UNVERIFIED_CONTAM: hypothetical protein PYX00_006570 [Menopon gallinae]|uniref:PX domain-containing protein n=1 Tax=Menopon gallinae TaxID=328185 RepID=A0AAW2HVS2_9NEOP